MVVMTAEQIAALKVGDHVSLYGASGVVKQTTPRWFMVTWDDSKLPIMLRRVSSILTERMELHA